MIWLRRGGVSRKGMMCMSESTKGGCMGVGTRGHCGAIVIRGAAEGWKVL